MRDGHLERAYEHLEDCEALVSGDGQTAWVWGVVLQEDGRYEAAAQAYRRVLRDFPEDRLHGATWVGCCTSMDALRSFGGSRWCAGY